MSSMITSTPSIPSSSVDILRWNISGAEEIPNGSLQNAQRPNGVMKVVNNWLSSSIGICQSPLAASTVENTFDSASSNLPAKVAYGVHVELLYSVASSRRRYAQLRFS